MFPEPSTADADAPGTTVPEIVGFCSSILKVNGPTFTQFPTLSHTVRLEVCTVDYCVPSDNDVVSWNDASEAFANPTPASDDVQPTDTSPLNHMLASGGLHLNVGAVVSMFTVVELDAELFPATSDAE